MAAQPIAKPPRCAVFRVDIRYTRDFGARRQSPALSVSFSVAMILAHDLPAHARVVNMRIKVFCQAI